MCESQGTESEGTRAARMTQSRVETVGCVCYLRDLEQDDGVLDRLDVQQRLGFDVSQADLVSILQGILVDPLIQPAHLVNQDLQVGVRLDESPLELLQQERLAHVAGTAVAIVAVAAAVPAAAALVARDEVAAWEDGSCCGGRGC